MKELHLLGTSGFNRKMETALGTASLFVNPLDIRGLYYGNATSWSSISKWLHIRGLLYGSEVLKAEIFEDFDLALVGLAMSNSVSKDTVCTFRSIDERLKSLCRPNSRQSDG